MQRWVGWDVHERKGYPLHAELSNSQKPGNALERADLAAALDIASRRWYGQDVGEAGSGRSGSEQDKPRRDALGGASGDDAIMLGEVGDEEADEDDARETLAVA